MKILLVGNFTPDAQESMLRFEGLLSAGWTTRGHVVKVASPTRFFTRLVATYRYNGLPKYLGYLDKFVRFPRVLRRSIRDFKPDVVHIIDHSNAVYGNHGCDVRTVVTCHDVMQIQAARGEFPQQRPGALGRRYQEWILGHLARIPQVACVSRATADQLRRLTSMPEDRIRIIPNALNYPYAPLPRDEALRKVREGSLSTRAAQIADLPGGFILNVGGGQWYKNRPGLLQIFDHLRRKVDPPPRLILVGKPLSAQDTALVRSLGLEDALVVCSSVSNADLQALYSAAECLLFPSWQEGFGWPIAEAQACGCPVFTSDRAPMNDVGGTSAVYFDPADPASAARIIAASWSNRIERAKIGLAEADRWSVGTMLDAYEALYRGVITGHPAPAGPVN